MNCKDWNEMVMILLPDSFDNVAIVVPRTSLENLLSSS
jgi:hypothetical protein